MSKTHRWLALVIAVALLAGALAPATAFASRGGNPIDNPGDPSIDPPLEYGDPDPGSGAPQSLWVDWSAWKQIFIASLRIRFGVPTVTVRPVQSGDPVMLVRSNRDAIK